MDFHADCYRIIMQFQTFIATSEPVPSILSISQSVKEKVCFLGLQDGDFEVSDDGPMILTSNP